MNSGTQFLILSLEGESYAVSISRLLEITVPRDIQRDAGLTEAFEGKFEYRGKPVPVLNLKKVFKLRGNPGGVLLILKNSRGEMGMLVDAVVQIVETDKVPIPIPKGVMNPSLLSYYGGIIRHNDGLTLILKEEGLFK